MIPVPFMSSLVELRAGIAMRQQQTRVIATGKGIDLLVLVAAIIGLSTTLPHMGPQMAPIALFLGITANYLFLRKFVNTPTSNPSGSPT